MKLTRTEAKEMTNDQLVDELWEHLPGAIFGMTAVTFGPIMFGFLIAAALDLGSPVWAMVWATLIIPTMTIGWYYARPWHIAKWELENRRDARKEEARKKAESQRQRAIYQPIYYNPDLWTGRRSAGRAILEEQKP